MKSHAKSKVEVSMPPMPKHHASEGRVERSNNLTDRYLYRPLNSGQKFEMSKQPQKLRCYVFVFKIKFIICHPAFLFLLILLTVPNTDIIYRNYMIGRLIMPLFEYICRKCGNRFEALVLGSTRPVCPSCQSPELEQELSTFAMGHNSGSATAAATSGEAACVSGGSSG